MSVNVDITNTVFSVFSFVTFFLVTIPLPWHLEAWNTGTCCFMIWTGAGCMMYFINSIVWRGNAINWAPVWCDISARLIIGLNTALPAASLVINRRLYKISCCNTVTITRGEKRRAVIIDLLLGVGLPIAAMALQYIPQGHRFDIFEDIGCFPATHNTIVAVFTVSGIPVVLGAISAYYSIRTVRAFYKRRAQYKALLSGHSNLSASRYVRLMALGSVDTLSYVPFAIFALVQNTAPDVISPFISWEDTKWGFSRMDQIPRVLWQAVPRSNGLEITRWLCVACGIMFFLFFGFADEAQRHYRLAFDSVVRRVPGYSSTSTSTTTTSKTAVSSFGKGSLLPVFNRRNNLPRKHSFDTMSDLSVSHISEKDAAAFDSDKSFGTMSFLDAGGLLKDDDDKNSLMSSLPTLPAAAVVSTHPRSLVINVMVDTVESSCSPHSSVVSPHSSVESMELPPSPDAVFDPSSPPKTENIV